MDDGNPLSKLRSLRAHIPESAEPPDGKTPYLAFKAVNRRQIRMHAKSAHNTTRYRAGERLTYSYLHRIIDDDDFNEQLGLVYQFAVVVIRGHHLFPVAEAIEREVCEWIQPYNAAKWDPPLDPEAPFIESIKIYVEREQMLKALEELVPR